MEKLSNFRLSQSALSLKVLITCFVLALSVGYALSLLQVRTRTHFDKSETLQHFRGSEKFSDVYIPQSTATMISVAHVHSFSQPLVVGLISFLFVFTGFSQGSKSFWIVLSFLGSFLNVITPWLIRDVSPHAIYLLYFSGFGMLGSFLVMAPSILYETWKKA